MADTDAVALVAEAQQLLATQGNLPEIEARVGRFDAKTHAFVAGVTHEQFMFLCNSLAAANFWMSDTPWETSHVCHHTLPDGRDVRSECPASGGDVRFVEKRKLSNVVLLTKNHASESARGARDVTQPAAKASLCVRLALATETPCQFRGSVGPATRAFVRRRRRFVLSDSKGQPTWEYALTKRWGGHGSVQTVYDAGLADDRATYEVEIECIGADYLRTHTAEYVAQSLAMKAAHLAQLLN